MEPAQIEFEIADDLPSWRAESPGRFKASAEALEGPTSVAGKRTQVHDPPGSEVGPGSVATYGTVTADEVDRVRLQVEPDRPLEQAHGLRLVGAGLRRRSERPVGPRCASAQPAVQAGSQPGGQLGEEGPWIAEVQDVEHVRSQIREQVMAQPEVFVPQPP